MALSIAERQELFGKMPTLLTRDEADAMVSYLQSKSEDGLSYNTASVGVMWVVEVRDATGKIVTAL